MKRSTLTFSFALAAVFALGAVDGCSSSGGGGNDGGGGTGPGGGSGGSAGGTTGSGGTTGGGGIGGTGATAGRGGASGGATGEGGCGGLGGTQGFEGDPCTSNGCLPGLSCVSCICVSAGGRGGGTAGSTGGAGGGGGGIAGNGGNGNGGRGGTGGSGGTAGAGTGGRGGNNGTGTGGRGGGAGGTGGIAATMTLTSTALTQGGMFMADNTCAGTNVSPPLTWTAGPSGTMSYGIALVDMTNGFVHWTIWDMPPTTMSLPAMLPTTQTLTTPVMAKQINRFQGDGYSGPCPMGQQHTYVFEVYALDVGTLPSVNLSGMPEMVRTNMMSHALASGTLSGTSNASP